MIKIKQFIGRREELACLGRLFKKGPSQMVVLYGRRRVGKSTLLEHFCSGRYHIYFTGRKGEREEEIRDRFLQQLSNTLKNPLIAKIRTHNWTEIFELLESSDKKIVLVLDEFQWMCSRRSSIISALQEQWDKSWKKSGKIYLVLCGSIISFMEKNVLSEKSPLYGRRTASFELEPLPPKEAKLFFPKLAPAELCQIMMTLGGIPSYLELIDPKESFMQNINRLALVKDGYFINEIEFILREQLKSFTRYSLLLESISQKPMSREEIARAMGIKNSGALNLYLKNLQSLHLIRVLTPITKPVTAKTQKYIIWDEFLRFYFSFIYSSLEQIQLNRDDWLFDKIVAPRWDSYCGYSFEVFCRKNIKAIISRLGVTDVFKRSGTYWRRGTASAEGVDIDIVIERTDRTTHLIECKWSSGEIGTSIIEEAVLKKKLYPNPLNHTLKTGLITTHGVTEEVKRSGALDDIITLKDLLN